MTTASDSRTAATLELRGLGCARGGRWLFRGLGASIPAGRLLRVQGGNGAGKTSLLRILCGLSAPSHGAVRWRGEPVAAQREAFGRELIYLGHAAALKDELSAHENLRCATALGGAPASAADADAALGAAGLRGSEHRPVRTLSQGQRRRVTLARLVCSAGAGLWLLDEPFNALDAAASQWLRGLMQAQLQRGGVIVLASHQDVALAGVAEPMVLAL